MPQQATTASCRGESNRAGVIPWLSRHRKEPLDRVFEGVSRSGSLVDGFWRPGPTHILYWVKSNANAVSGPRAGGKIKPRNSDDYRGQRGCECASSRRVQHRAFLGAGGILFDLLLPIRETSLGDCVMKLCTEID